MQLHPIGTVVSPFKEKFGTPRQPGLVETAVGRIRLRDNLNPDALDGLNGFSHIWILFYFHQNHRDGRSDHTIKTKVHPPRLGGQAVGVFATRSPHRPNPIGLSLVELIGIEGRDLIVGGLDIIDGTPVLDIKPYLPSIESKPNAHGGWSEAIPERTVTCTWSEESLRDLVHRFGPDDTAVKNTRRAIESILSLDPRPVVYRGSSANPNPYTSRYGFRFDNVNVVYEMLPGDPAASAMQSAAEAPERAHIVCIEPWAGA